MRDVAAASPVRSWTSREQWNYLLTNRVPRRLLTQLMGWYSGIENPTLARWSIAVWKALDRDLDLRESKRRDFRSLRECFIRELREGVRPIDPCPRVVTSPCDGIVGACGRVEGTTVFQAKGFPYELADLIPDPDSRSRLRDGVFVTLRLKPGMYHRFHAPLDCRIDGLTYISGDTWNVNPVTLRRIERLFCRNERAILELLPPDGDIATGAVPRVVLVPVAAILVASMKFRCLPDPLDIRYRGPSRIPCRASYARGEEMGYFQHGSTILVFADRGYRLADGVETGKRLNMGQPLLVDDDR